MLCMLLLSANSANSLLIGQALSDFLSLSSLALCTRSMDVFLLYQIDLWMLSLSKRSRDWFEQVPFLGLANPLNCRILRGYKSMKPTLNLRFVRVDFVSVCLCTLVLGEQSYFLYTFVLTCLGTFILISCPVQCPINPEMHTRTSTVTCTHCVGRIANLIFSLSSLCSHGLPLWLFFDWSLVSLVLHPHAHAQAASTLSYNSRWKLHILNDRMLLIVMRSHASHACPLLIHNQFLYDFFHRHFISHLTLSLVSALLSRFRIVCYLLPFCSRSSVIQF